uniref:Glutamine-dependent NAD(+) synthetase n=1 Tax=Tetradesmus obliquus TaxID=3088 RepID=A0A383W8A4_TETOB|eukprot:jgi/Sobl393_1/2794/SZX73877.1
MRRRLATLATCSLNQWAMDFEGNLRRIQHSIAAARKAGATYRVGPELEVCGYGCEDHFFELDTVEHCWEVLQELLVSDATHDLLVDVGMPVIHRGVLYNCRLLLLDGKVLLIRPKLHLANDGNYRETRYFASWKHKGQLEEHSLPRDIAAATGQSSCSFGDGVLCLADATLASETCEELFTPQAPHISLALAGVEVISNGSGSHHQLRKLDTRLDLIKGATAKAGGVYMYANQQGCDGGRLYYDGCACIAVNGGLVAQGSQFSLGDVEVVTATVPPRIHAPEEEIALGPACWLWDYLRRSGASGFLLPLSGGADSSCTAAIVGSMCQLAVKAIAAGDAIVAADAARIGQYAPGQAVADASELAGRLFHTTYMGTVNSSGATRQRAKVLAQEIGAYHVDCNIDSLVAAVVALFGSITGKTPRFRVDGGSNAENLALQNIQARLRMVVAFLLAQLLPWVRGRGSFLLVLGSANVDEALRGYLTKYDCSAADINPIGGISKADLRRFLTWAAVHLGYPHLAEVEAAPPTAELEPLREGIAPQSDEADMGMSYEELGLYGRLRKVSRCGPLAMFRQACSLWRERYTPQQVGWGVKHFFKFYAINRHKATVLTPSYHAESYSPDDNRFDHRPFLYNTAWPWQFRRIDALAADLPQQHHQQQQQQVKQQ